MTAEPDLLPELVAEGLDFFNLAGDEGDKLYVSAIRQHIAAKDAEIEALRAEVERANSWNARVSVCRDHVADIVDGLCVICVLDAAKARADKLAEALWEYGLPLTGDDKRDAWEFGYEAFAREKRRRAALEQEDGHECPN